MSILGTQLNPRSADFLANAAAMQALVNELHARCDQNALGGNEARAPSMWRAASCCRERVQRLLDPGTPFLELSPLAALNMYNNDAPAPA
jgi:3-methylcrotonyl-CoA carboxylase beta subunit